MVFTEYTLIPNDLSPIGIRAKVVTTRVELGHRTETRDGRRLSVIWTT